jgi:hypothetical protein
MSDHSLPPSDTKGVNPDGLGPAQPQPVEGDRPERGPDDDDDTVSPPDDDGEMSDNLKRERSKGSAATKHAR